MGKVSCEACRKRCKGQAIKLADEKFFHMKCFTCKECGKQLSSKEFYTVDSNHYCPDDYRRLFAVRCRGCGKPVEGDVVTVLSSSFHPDCFQCSKCRSKLVAGDKVTSDGKEFICHGCMEPVSPPVVDTVAPPVDSAPTSASRPHQIAVDQLNSPDSDISMSMRDYTTDGRSPLSPVSVTSGYKSDASYDQTPETRPNGVLLSTSYSNTDSRGFLSPNLHFMQYRSTSPVSNASSRKSRDSASSGGLGRQTPDFGKFYKTTYMDLKDGYKRGPSINGDTTEKLPQHFHRPEGFSYRKVRTDILKPTKKASRSFFGIKSQVRTEPYKPVKTQEPIQLSKLPDAQIPDKNHMSPIERDDWPSPPAPAAAYPELLRGGRISRRSGTYDMTDSAVDAENKENNGRTHVADPKIERDIIELSKLSDSGAAKVILKDLQKKKYEEVVLDPRSASRTPNASIEPPYRTRYESPMFASPSRDLDLRQQLPPLDESFSEVKYRTPSPANFLSPRPGYGLRSFTIDSRATGYLSDPFDGYYSRRPGSSAAVLERTSLYSSQSDIEEFDPTTGLRRNSRLRSTAASDGRRTPYMSTHRRSVPNVFKVDEPIKVYPYQELRLTNSVLPHGVDKNALEQYLTKEEFEQLFHMTQDDFYRLAEWKRNDIKKRVELF